MSKLEKWIIKGQTHEEHLAEQVRNLRLRVKKLEERLKNIGEAINE